VDRAAAPEIRRSRAGAVARGREASLETGLGHPIFDPLRPWLERLGADRSLQRLNAFAGEIELQTASGRPVEFVTPGSADAYYEVHLYETGRVQTRPDNLHDLFNALAWLAFPRTKALINAMHAREIPREGGRRGRKRDLLTLLDEGGVIVQCDDPQLNALVRGFRWKELFWDQRERVRQAMRFRVLGHATLEQALQPWPGIACKAVFVGTAETADALTHAWLAALAADATPRDLVPLPVFGYPGWLPANERAEFYDDARYFRPFRERPGMALPSAVKWQRESAGQPLGESTEESPGSAERDAG
jgi:Protein of unknown function (DUF3025)